MTDISTKSLLHAQLSAHSGVFQEPGARPLGLASDQAPNGETISEGIENARQEIGSAQGFGSDNKRDNPSARDESKARYTILVRDRSGEQRALTVTAASAEEAAKVAQSALDKDEEVLSVSESTVPPPPDPNRGLVA